MKNMLFLLLAAGAALTVQSGGARPTQAAPSDWRKTVAERIPLYGHRNWIAIVDSAYPAQSRDGIETVVADADQAEVVKAVLQDLAGSRHVRPIVFTDAELNYVDEKDAPGVGAYRKQLAQILGEHPATSLLHEQIIHNLDEAGQTFRILIIKTNMTIPYTSVFLQLNCKYWSDGAEQRLRALMPAQAPPAGK